MGSRRGYAFNRTRQSFLATDMRVANTHWTRLRGLMWTNASSFGFGQGLWIVPCHGVHTWAMRFPIDLAYLDADNIVVHVEENVRPWRFAAVRMDAATVLELPWHTIWNSGTKIGDQIELHFEKSDRDPKERVVAA
ncbi:MAG TPA: DUF192 domain-containing protein [Terriglobales bacterium]|jgi:uncharacterized membrane protein (UPF0127 family)|nr:DUF192 domain-containing protein [Terriglobales bacterium]